MYKALFAIFTFAFSSCACGPKEDKTEPAANLESKAASQEDEQKKGDVSDPSKESLSGTREVDAGEEEGRGRVEGSAGGDVISLLSIGEVSGVRPISQRSLSLKVGFEGGGKAVFKPLRKGNRSARFEVAFSRLAFHLKVDGAPRAVARALPSARVLGNLRKHFPETAERFSTEVAVDEGGLVHGAMIEWMEDLGPSGLDGPKGKARVKSLLGGFDKATVQEEGNIGAKAVSDMIVLDYLTGNWDRFSGGNLFADSGGRLILIDNNGAFSRWSDRQRERMEGYLAMLSRFSPDLIGRMEKLDAKSVGSVVRGKMGKLEILSEEEIGLLLERRDEIISHVEKAKAAGESVWF